MCIRDRNWNGIGNKLFSLESNKKWRSFPGGHTLSGIETGFEAESKSALQLNHSLLADGSEQGVGLLLVDVSHKLDDDLGIGVTLKVVALGLQQVLDLLVVGDDAVVDYNEVIVLRPGEEMCCQKSFV